VILDSEWSDECIDFTMMSGWLIFVVCLLFTQFIVEKVKATSIFNSGDGFW